LAIVRPEFAPITHCLGVIRLSFDRLLEVEEAWRPLHSVEYEFRHLQGDLPSQLEQLLPLTGPRVRELWVDAGDHCVFFDNFVNASDPQTAIDLSREYKCRAFLVSASPDGEFSYGQTRLDVYGPEGTSPLGIVRIISATNDGGRWSWDVSGEPLEFENVEYYRRRRIRDRFPRWLLEEYCRALSIPVFEESFYGTRGLLISNMARRSLPNLRTESLEDRRAQLGLGQASTGL